MSRRIKHVFSNGDEVAHVWAQQRLDWGRNSSGSVSFQGTTIYSYAAKIAKFVKMPNGKTAVLFNDSSYSMTTNKHQWSISSAVKGQTVVKIPVTFWFNYVAGKEYFIREIKDQLNLSSKATKYALSHLERAGSLISKLHKWGTLHRRHAYYKFSESEMAIVKRAKAQKAKLAERVRLQTIVDKKRRVLQLQELNEVCGGDMSAYWRLHGKLPEKYNKYQYTKLIGTLCRVVGNDVVTSVNAKVPIEHAKRLLPIVKACHDKQRSRVISSSTPIRIGYYSVQSISANGDIKIGCHDIEWLEVELLGKQLLPEIFGV